jgi:hypothetical protein
MGDSIQSCPGPILCAHLLRKVDAKLLELLASFRPDEWDLETVAPAWRVRDVAAHLLDTALRKLSLVRDRWFVEQSAIRSPEDLVALVNRLNREGVTVYRRLSPPTLISLIACRESADFHESLDPFAPAAFGWVSRIVCPRKLPGACSPKGVRRDEAEKLVRIEGDRDLTLWDLTAIVG